MACTQHHSQMDSALDCVLLLVSSSTEQHGAKEKVLMMSLRLEAVLGLEAIASKLETIAVRLVGWGPSIVGWRPLLLD